MVNQSGFKVLLLILMIFGIVIPLFTLIALQFQNSSIKDDAVLASHELLYVDIETKKSQLDVLNLHLQELEVIRIKALNDLVELDQKRVALQREIESSTAEKEKLLKESRSYAKQIQRMKKEAESKREWSRQKVVTNVIHVGIPKSHLYMNQKDDFPHKMRKTKGCQFDSCFDYSQCSILKKFSFYLYESEAEEMFKIMSKFAEYSSNVNDACVTFVSVKITNDISKINQYLYSLPSWKGSGTNHVLLLNSLENNDKFCSLINKLKRGNSILVTTVHCDEFQDNFDILVPAITSWMALPPLFPTTRKFFLSFYSQELSEKSIFLHKEDLSELQTNKDIFIKTQCDEYARSCLLGWCACGSIKIRGNLLQNSMFSIVVGDIKSNFLSEIIDCFKNGAVPVIIGSIDNVLFSSVIDWKLATIIIPYQRLPELLYILQTMTISDIIDLKWQGRFLYQTYFSTQTILLRSVISLIKNKIFLPPTPIKDYTAININNITRVPQGQEILEVAFSSRKFGHNFTYSGKNQHRVWNTYPGAVDMYPVVPWVEAVPSQVQFLEEGKDAYMPIGDGKGGDGVAFSRSLGGDYPVEQFTVLMLTYDREVILMEALQRLSGMKYLNKVIVVWNHPDNPGEDLSWPDIGVKIEVIRTGRNSLNNRFIPYAAIETEAVLSMDDDIYLRHDEIELAFRVWRENRDRLVGFPGRHHAYNESSKSFYYNSEHSCELSLVLTGGAFFHKYYSYIYTLNMDASIRQMVDDYMNCEDIAMNFLVAHITKKPPIKVTSRWTFRCPGCPVALSADANHYKERNNCMALFEKVYGYNPLKRTQFRADSILFKTRLPSTMTKCFQFV